MQQELVQNVSDIVHHNYNLTPDRFVLLIYDLNCQLARMLAQSYQIVMKKYPHESIHFSEISEEALISKLEALPPHSLVILVQSLSFRVTKYRLRTDLFRLGHQVIEHARLAHNTEEQRETYIHSLRYDTPAYVRTTNALEALLAKNEAVRIHSAAGILTLHPPFEKPIKNTGDFTHNPTASSGFPIGEIFTEACNLEHINGSVTVFGFPTEQHLAEFTVPFTVHIEKGQVVSHNGPAKFEEMLHLIKAEETAVNIREIGFGLNKALDFEHRLREPTAFERFSGMHFSLGLKHTMYRHKLHKKVLQKYHIDIFCIVEKVFIGETLIFEKGKYVI